MEAKYTIKLENNGNSHSVVINVNDCTDDFHINFLDFADKDISLNKISQFDLRPPINLIQKNVNDSVYKEIYQRRKIRAKINDIDGCFYPNDKGVFVWKEESVQKGLPLVDGVVIERLNDKSARVKILLNYSNTSVQVNKNSSASRLKKKFVIWEGVYSIHQKLSISTLLNSRDLLEEYEIPIKLMDGFNELKVLKDISQFKISSTVTERTDVQTQVAIKAETESNIRTNDDRYRIDEMNKLKERFKSQSDKLKNLEEENARCFSQKATLEKEKAFLETEVRKYSEDKKKFANVTEREEGFNQIIAELKPYQEFYKEYAESKLIEEIKLDFEQLAKFRQSIENLSKSKNFPEEQKIIDTFGAFTELNRILIFEVDANDGILDKIAAYDANFSSSLSEFRNLLKDVNQSIIDSCKNTEDFSLKMIPNQLVIELANPNNYEVIKKFNHSFLDLNILFSDFTESGWDTLLSVLENLRKLVNINRGK